MNLVLHQLRYDIRAFRIALGIWFTMLALSLVSNLGWVGSTTGQALLQNNSSGQYWTEGLLFVLWAVGLILPALVVLADSPAKTDSFLSTRPMPGRDLYFAKALFIVLMIVAPLVLQEALYLALSRLSLHFIVRGALERLLWASLFTTLSAGFAGIWRDAKEWVAGLASTAVAGWALAAIAAALIINYSSHQEISDNTMPLVMLGWCAPTFLVLMLLNHRYRWKAVWRGVATVLLTFVGTMLATFWPWDFFPSKAGDPGAVQTLAASFALHIAPRDFHVTSIYKAKANGLLNVQASVAPDADDLPPGISIDWACSKSDLVSASGKTVNFKANTFGTGMMWNQMKSQVDVRNISRSLGPDTLISSQFYNVQQGPASVSIGNFDAPDSFLKEQSTLKTELNGSVSRLEIVAILPWVKGATYASGAERWTVLGVKQDPRNPTSQTQAALEYDAVALGLSGDQFLKAPDTYYNDYNLALYDESQGEAVLAQYPIYSMFNTGSETAYPHQFLVVNFPQSPMNPIVGRTKPSSLKIVVMRKRFLGTIKRRWDSASFALADSMNTTAHVNQAQNEQMSLSEFNQRLSAINPANPESTRIEVGLYLTDVLSLVQSFNSRVPEDHPLVAQLARLVPAHLAVFLDGVIVTDSWDRDLLLRAIQRGALESQKSEIIAALHRAPDLAGVLLHRGWMKDSEQALFGLLDNPHPLGATGFQAIAWYGDPETYPGLLGEFVADPTVSKYDWLRTLPGIGKDLDAAVTRIWNTWPHQLDGSRVMPRELIIALHAGRQNALEEVFRIINLDTTVQARSGNWSALNELRNVIEFPEDERNKIHDNRVLADWLSKHSAADFHFDVLRQRFVLQQP